MPTRSTPSNLLTFDANYTTASTNRYNNTNFNNILTTPATNLTNGTECFAYNERIYTGGKIYRGPAAPCNSPLTSGTFANPEPAPAFPGASWQVTYTGNSGFVNNVDPELHAVALQDQWNPTDKLNVNLGLRDEITSTISPIRPNNGQNFGFSPGSASSATTRQTLAPYFIPVPPASGRPPNPVHRVQLSRRQLDSGPPGADRPSRRQKRTSAAEQHLQSDAHRLRVYAAARRDLHAQPRHGAALLGRAVTRKSRETYQVQYNAKDNNLAYDLFQAFWQYGYTTPRHDPQVQYSDNYDASYERRFKGTDMSIKVTPYYRYATNQIYSIGLPFGLAGGLN